MCVRADDGARQRYQLSAGRVRFFLKKVLPTSTHPYGIEAALSKKKEKKDVFSVSAASAPCLLKISLHSDVRGAAWRKELELV